MFPYTKKEEIDRSQKETEDTLEKKKGMVGKERRDNEIWRKPLRNKP
jgi:hypothetical protein